MQAECLQLQLSVILETFYFIYCHLISQWHLLISQDILHSCRRGKNLLRFPILALFLTSCLKSSVPRQKYPGNELLRCDFSLILLHSGPVNLFTNLKLFYYILKNLAIGI